MKTVMITGGAGFIGSNLIKYWLSKYPKDRIINLDALTYAARPEYLLPFVSSAKNYHLEMVDLRIYERVLQACNEWIPDVVINLAAESHVCRSIEGPRPFFQTNVMGTVNLLEALRVTGFKGHFHHVSTDEVYGQLSEFASPFDECTAYAPRSPYAASKAASDHAVKAYHETYGLKATISNCSNNFGPNQHDEKLIPKTIQCIMDDRPVRIYGDGTQIRDWLWVLDHCSAIDTIISKGKAGETYCVGGDREMSNLEMVEYLGHLLMRRYTLDRTADRPTDDFRYAIDSSKLKLLGWRPDKDNFGFNIISTIEWYLDRMKRGGRGLQGQKTSETCL